MECTKSLLKLLQLLSLACLAVRGEFTFAPLQERRRNVSTQLLHAQLKKKTWQMAAVNFCTCAHGMPSLRAGAPPVEPQLSHRPDVPDISGGIGPTDVNIQPANVSLHRSILSLAR